MNFWKSSCFVYSPLLLSEKNGLFSWKRSLLGIFSISKGRWTDVLKVIEKQWKVKGKYKTESVQLVRSAIQIKASELSFFIQFYYKEKMLLFLLVMKTNQLLQTINTEQFVEWKKYHSIQSVPGKASSCCFHPINSLSFVYLCLFDNYYTVCWLHYYS